MTRDPADLDYRDVLKRTFTIGTRPQNLFVLLGGAAVVLFGSIFSGFLLAGPLGVGYADACGRMARGRRAELDDIFWRGIDRPWPAILAGFPLGILTFVLSFVLVVPGLLALLFSALVFSTIAFDKEERSGFDAIQRAWNLVMSQSAPIIIMWLVAAFLGGLMSMTVIGVVPMVGFLYLVSFFVYVHYFGDDASPGVTEV